MTFVLFTDPLKLWYEQIEKLCRILKTHCLGYDVYVLGDVTMDLIKGTIYTLYNDLVMLGLDQLICKVTRPESNSCFDRVYVGNPSNMMTSSLASILSDLCPVAVVRIHNGSFAKTNMHRTNVILKTLMNASTHSSQSPEVIDQYDGRR